ncbi:MAG: peptidase T, partial [Firmicutes bacterium]|nr:peptidase T [Bacillota bacterium]
EGFYHLMTVNGAVDYAEMDYIIRDHSREIFEERKAKMQKAVEDAQKAHPKAHIELIMKDTYYNMVEKLTDCMHLVDNAKKAIEMSGMTPVELAIRGGTDGAKLSFMGLPCPNLGTGGYNFHGPFELVTVEDMDTVVGVLKNIVKIYAEA